MSPPQPDARTVLATQPSVLRGQRAPCRVDLGGMFRQIIVHEERVDRLGDTLPGAALVELAHLPALEIL